MIRLDLRRAGSSAVPGNIFGTCQASTVEGIPSGGALPHLGPSAGKDEFVECQYEGTILFKSCRSRYWPQVPSASSPAMAPGAGA
jgi:hypothetical protein